MTTIDKNYSSIKTSLKQLNLERNGITYNNPIGLAYSPAYNRIVIWFSETEKIEVQESDLIYTND